MKKIYTILLFIITFTTLSAQRLGLQGGYSFTYAMPSIDLSSHQIGFSQTIGSGFNVGPIFAWNFHKYFGADIAVMANYRGANLRVTYDDETPILYKHRLWYLNIPLHAYFYQHIKNVDFSIFAGPSFNVGLDGYDYAMRDNDYHFPMFDSQIDGDDIFGEENRYKRFEIGIEVGVGVEWKHITWRASWMQGLNNITENSGYPYGLEAVGSGIKETFRQGMFNFSVGYIFDLKRKTKTYTK